MKLMQYNSILYSDIDDERVGKVSDDFVYIINKQVFAKELRKQFPNHKIMELNNRLEIVKMLYSKDEVFFPDDKDIIKLSSKYFILNDRSQGKKFILKDSDGILVKKGYIENDVAYVVSELDVRTMNLISPYCSDIGTLNEYDILLY